MDDVEISLRGWLKKRAVDVDALCCEKAEVHPIDAYNGEYGCDTGCEYVRLEAETRCPVHGTREWMYGEFGDLAGLLADFIDKGIPYLEQARAAHGFAETHLSADDLGPIQP